MREPQHASDAREVRLARAADVPAGDRRWLVHADGRVVGVFRLDGQFHAYENRCPHQGGPVCSGRVMPAVKGVVHDDGTVVHELAEDEPHLVCPWHGWEFDLRTGRCVADPRFGLRKLNVVERDGDLFIQR